MASPSRRSSRAIKDVDHEDDSSDRGSLQDQAVESEAAYSEDEQQVQVGRITRRASIQRPPGPEPDPEDSFSSPPGSSYSPEPEDSDASSAADKTQDQLEPEEFLGDRPYRRSLLKRSRSETGYSVEPEDFPRPFKRVKGVVNHDYISMLNADIEDARDLTVPHRWPQVSASQVGLTFWSPEEKHFFFEALSRVGKKRPDLIAQRVGTKGEMEVRQYIELLEQAKLERKQAGQLEILAVHEIPAAVELRQECVAALEHAADAVSLRQEAHEDSVQSRRYGEGSFLLTHDNFLDLEDEARSTPDNEDHPLSFFKARNWLELPTRVFMNASFEEANWQSVSNEPPSIRLEALGDFYSITKAVTRKLIAEAIFNAKVTNRGRGGSPERLTVRRSHVPSPEQVVGKQTLAGRELFFAGCARRLRLNVVDDEADGDAAHEPMSYDDVESALSAKLHEKHRASVEASQRPEEASSEESDEEALAEEFGHLRTEETNASVDGLAAAEEREDAALSDDSVSSVDMADSDPEVEEEVEEVLIHSALGVPTTTKTKNALRRRIRGEHEREILADEVDRRAGYVEERRIWEEVLGSKPTVPLERVPEPNIRPTAASARRRKFEVDDLIPP